jgi:ComF family protein
VFAAYVQDGPLVRAVHRAKFGSDLAPCRAMGRLLAEALGPRLEDVDVVVPVALHRARLVERGFNQAAEIAKALRKPVAYDALTRVKRTRAQATLSREDRRDNVRDAFVLARPRAIEGKRALLVDDVVTTGATMEAARVALEAGAPRSILCAAVARAVLWADRR